MARLTRIFIIHTTSGKEKSQTDAAFELIASRPKTDLIMPFPKKPWVAGRTEEYEFNVEGQDIYSNTELTMVMKTTDNGWLPERIWVLGETQKNKMVVLAAHLPWTKGFFDRNSSENPDRHVISNSEDLQ